MGLLHELKNILAPGQSFKSQQMIAGSLTDVSFWEKWGINRKNTRIRYDGDSAFTAYRSHELVYACINKIADVMNDAEIVVEKKNGKGEWEKQDGHLLTALFKRPNSNQTGRDVRKLMVQSEQGLGLFYGYIERSNAGIPVTLTVLNPNRITVKYDQSQESILYYEYQTRRGKRVLIKKEDLLIRRRPDLLDQFGGYAPLSAALKSINSDLGLTDYVDAFFESDGTPSGILKILNSTVSDTKREELQAKWKRKYGRGGELQKGVAVLDQNAEFQKIGSNLDELASQELSGRFESRICAVFGVPPNLVGAYVGLVHVTANATAKAELQNFWDNKISGELAVMREWLTWFVLPEFENIEDIRAERIRVGYDISHVAFLQDDVKEIEARARENLKSGGITLNEFRQSIGLGPDPKGDYYLQPVNVSVLSPENRAIEAAQKVPAGTDPKELPEPTPPKSLPGTKEKKTFDLDGLTLGRAPQGVELLIDLKKIVADFESEKQKAANILKKFRLDLIAQAVQQLDKLDAETAHTLTLTPDPKIRKRIGDTLKSAYLTGRKQIQAELAAQRSAKGSLPVDTKDADEVEYLEYLKELTDGLISRIINGVTTRAVDQYLILKLLNDFTLDLLAELLEEQSEKFVEQAAGNTVNAAIAEGRDDEIQAQGDSIGHTEYSAILDKNTCSPCADADGMTADDPLDLPAAPNPECEGGDQCRCIHVGVIA